MAVRRESSFAKGHFIVGTYVHTSPYAHDYSRLTEYNESMLPESVRAGHGYK